MTYRLYVTPGSVAERFLTSFPIACFTLALITDIIYWRTSYLMWSNFSSWLLFFGLVFGALAAAVALIGGLARGDHTTSAFWPYIGGGALVLVLALLNSFVHAGDGWTAVVPMGLILSFLTVLAMAGTSWLAYSRNSREIGS